MSGIAGIISFDGGPVEPVLIHGMTAAMAHRGPDGIGCWSRGPLALGHCMLQTTPESLEETQPLMNEDESLVLVMDGRVDNWEELRTELRADGAHLRNRSDAELVLRSYERWGSNCLRHIDGDFALAIWDARRHEVFCARDRIGLKPFLYHWDGRCLAFASEARAILELPWVPRKLNEGVVAEFIANDWCTRDETFWQGIYRLVPAHRMRVGTEGPRIDEYWTPSLNIELHFKHQSDYVEHYRTLLVDVIRRLSRSHKPLGCEVSGGLDSSAVFAVGEHLRREGKLLAPGIEGYTLLFGDGSEADEVSYARAVGSHLAREVREIRPTRESLDWHCQWAQSRAAFPPYPNGSFALSIRQAAREAGSAVLLTGVGGDEWLGGSRIYYAETIAKGDWRALFDSTSADARAYGWTMALWWIFRQGFYPLLPEKIRSEVRKLLKRGAISQVNQNDRLTPTLAAALKGQKQKLVQGPPLVTGRIGQRGQIAPLFSAFSKFAKEAEELLAASVGIELRLPFYSVPMIDFSLATNTRMRIRGDLDRVLHRDAMAGFLPELVRNRQTKADFMITYAWYLPELRALLLSHDVLSSRGWVRDESIGTLFAQAGKAQGWPEWAIWSLFGCLAIAGSDMLRQPS